MYVWKKKEARKKTKGKPKILVIYLTPNYRKFYFTKFFFYYIFFIEKKKTSLFYQ